MSDKIVLLIYRTNKREDSS